MTNTERTIIDDFNGDDANLIESAKALIHLSDSGSLAPHGIGGHGRAILSAFIVRTESALARAVPVFPSSPIKVFDDGPWTLENGGCHSGGVLDTDAFLRYRDWMRDHATSPQDVEEVATSLDDDADYLDAVADVLQQIGKVVMSRVVRGIAAHLRDLSNPTPDAAARARRLLADAQEQADGHGVNARLFLDERTSLRCTVTFDVALRAIERALTTPSDAGGEAVAYISATDLEKFTKSRGMCLVSLHRNSGQRFIALYTTPPNPGDARLRALAESWKREADEIDARGLACNSNSIRARSDELLSLLDGKGVGP